MLNYQRGDILLDINMQFHKGVLFIRLKGELNENTVNKLSNEVTNFIKENGIGNTVYNIEKLNQIDYYGIKALLNNYDISKKNNGKSLVCGMQDGLVKHRIKNSRLLNYMYETSDELSAINMINL